MAKLVPAEITVRLEPEAMELLRRIADALDKPEAGVSTSFGDTTARRLTEGERFRQGVLGEYYPGRVEPMTYGSGVVSSEQGGKLWNG